MARAKNRGYQQSFSPSYTIRRWRLGIYIRLSKEDLKKGKDDSNSVKNQRDLLNDFTDATLTSLKASRNMWIMVILERTPTVKIFNGSWRMS